MAGSLVAARSVINISLFEVCSVLMSDGAIVSAEHEHDAIRATIVQLLQDENFARSITYSTNSTSAIRTRFAALQKALDEVLLA